MIIDRAFVRARCDKRRFYHPRHVTTSNTAQISQEYFDQQKANGLKKRVVHFLNRFPNHEH